MALARTPSPSDSWGRGWLSQTPPSPVLLDRQRLQRIHRRRPARRDVAGDERDRHHRRGGGGQRRKIERRDAKHQRVERSRGRDRHRQANHDTDERDPAALHDDHPANLGRPGAERHPHRHFARPARDDVGQDAIDPDRAEHDRQAGGNREQQHRERQLRHRAFRQRLHREHAIHRRFGRVLAQHGADVGGDRVHARRLDDIRRRPHAPAPWLWTDRRKVDQRIGFLLPEILEPDVINDADDGVPRGRLRVGVLQALAEGVFLGPERLRSQSADEHVGRSQRVRVFEPTALHQPDAHRLKIVAAGVGEGDARGVHDVMSGTLGDEAARAGAFVERQLVDEADRLHAGDRGHPPHELAVKRGPRRPVHELLRALRRGLERKDVLGLEAGVDAAHRDEAADEQASADEQHQCRRRLDDDESVAGPASLTGDAAAALLGGRR